MGLDLAGQGDFGHQHEHAAALRHHLGRGPQIYLGFAASCDAVQKKGRKAALAQSGGDLGQDLLLFIGQRRRDLLFVRRQIERIALDFDLLDRHKPCFGQGGKGAPGRGIAAAEFGPRHRPLIGRQLAQYLYGALGAGFEGGRRISVRGKEQAHAGHPLDAHPFQTAGQGLADHLANGMAVVIGEPLEKFEQGGGKERLFVEDREDLLELFCGAVLWRPGEQGGAVAGYLPLAEGHPAAHTHRYAAGERPWHQVGKGLGKWRGDRYLGVTAHTTSATSLI